MSLRKVLILILGMIILVGCSACETRVVPPGTVVMVAKTSGEIETHKKGSYTAWGRDRVYFIDTTLKSFTEHLKILCKDKVNMDVDVKWVGRFDADKTDTIRQIVPSAKVDDSSDISGYKLSLPEFYATAMKDIIHAKTRLIVAPYVTDNIPEQRVQIEKEVKKLVLERLESLDYPVITSDVLISNLDFDEKVTETRKEIKQAELEDQKQAALAKAKIAQAARNAEIAIEEGKAKVEEAKAEAAANKIREKSLTHPILMEMQFKAIIAMAAGQNNTIFFAPYDALSAGLVQNGMIYQGVTKR